MDRLPKVGLLLHFLKLYDDLGLGARQELERFAARVAEDLRSRGLDVVMTPVSRIQSEFAQSIEILEKEGVDLIISLHLAYSPSLESIDVICKTRTPLLILDTTPDPSFNQDQAPSRILFNHGIHGVQDFACMLRRRRRPYRIVAGPSTSGDLFDRAAENARGALAAKVLRNARVLRVGPPFEGMGDFAVEETVLREKLGLTVESIDIDELGKAAEAVTPAEIDAEMARDRDAFECQAPDEVHRRSTRVGLGLRRVLEEHRIDAFSIVFLAFDRSSGPVSTVPFLETSKAMSCGLGYAGEGDMLSAAMVGALN
ncbi:hypothetical protein HQ520_01640, partial [bacterium]|nr:hypothetical protein [bacterium]